MGSPLSSHLSRLAERGSSLILPGLTPKLLQYLYINLNTAHIVKVICQDKVHEISKHVFISNIDLR